MRYFVALGSQRESCRRGLFVKLLKSIRLERLFRRAAIVYIHFTADRLLEQQPIL